MIKIKNSFVETQLKVLKWTLPIGFLLAVIVIIFISSESKKNRIKYPKIDNIDSFHGQVKHEREYQGVSYIELSDSSFFRINHSINYNIKPSDLHDFIRTGDSIYKNKYSDTLIVVRDEKKYVFKIGKIISADPDR